jgi:hypothetical protein
VPDVQYYLCACADSQGQVIEDDEANNCHASAGQVVISTQGFAVSASPAQVVAGESITVDWQAPAGHCDTDWVALYPDDPNSGFLTWQYVGSELSGALTFTAPLTAGSYEFRYLLCNGSNVAVTSEPVIVEVSTTTTTTTVPTTTTTTLPPSAKASVCHGRGIEIEVSTNALAAHLRHGDTLGPCPGVAGQSQAYASAAPSAARDVEEVSIMIDPPRVPTLAQGLVTVAVLTTPGFDPADLREGSVCFGAAADAALRDCTEAHGRDRGHLGDADGDGDLDLVLHYEPAAMGIAARERHACLSGEKTQGLRIEGCADLAATP